MQLFTYQRNGIATFAVSEQGPLPELIVATGHVRVVAAGQGVAGLVVVVTHPEIFEASFGQVMYPPQNTLTRIVVITISRYDAGGQLNAGVPDCRGGGGVHMRLSLLLLDLPDEKINACSRSCVAALQRCGCA